MKEAWVKLRDSKIRTRILVFVAVAFVVMSLTVTHDGDISLRAQPPTEVMQMGEASQHPFVGVGSCTAAGCHGGGNPDGIIGSEYNIWISRDPHAKAYSDLFSERSQRMVRLLAGNTDQPVTPAHEDPRCLACHSTVKADAADLVVDEHVLEFAADGVGCEACHGPAGDWIAAHSERRLGSEERTRLGMTNTDSLRVRAEVCVACHVGGLGRDVNHDLIAAGHPRLQFSMTAYWEALPKHWDNVKDRARLGPNFDAAMWAFGQAATAEAALRQTERRAAPGQPWPEFSELSCTACHHDLRNDATLQQAVKDRNNLSGRLIAGDPWNLFAPRELAAEVSVAFDGDAAVARGVDESLAKLAEVRATADVGAANRSVVASAAGAAAEQVDEWAGGFRASALDRRRANQLMQAVIAHALADQELDWSTMAQVYDALASLQQTQLQYDADGTTNTNDQAIAKLLAKLFDELAAAPVGQTATRPARDLLQEISRQISVSGGSP